MQELSDITSGLSELLQSSAQARAKEQGIEMDRERERGKEEAAVSKTGAMAATDTPLIEMNPLTPAAASRNLLSLSEGLTSNL